MIISYILHKFKYYKFFTYSEMFLNNPQSKLTKLTHKYIKLSIFSIFLFTFLMQFHHIFIDYHKKKKETKYLNITFQERNLERKINSLLQQNFLPV